MAVVNYPNRRSVTGRAPMSAPLEVQMLETSGLLGLFCLLHLVAGLAQWTSMAAAILLWAAVNARSLQESDATLAQRFFGLRLGTPRALPLHRVIVYSFVMGGLGVVAWVLDKTLSADGHRSVSHRITSCEIETAVDPLV